MSLLSSFENQALHKEDVFAYRTDKRGCVRVNLECPTGCWSSFGMDSTFQVGDSDVKRPQENVVLLAYLPLLVLVSYSVSWLLLSLLPSLAIIRNQLLDSPR